EPRGPRGVGEGDVEEEGQEQQQAQPLDDAADRRRGPAWPEPLEQPADEPRLARGRVGEEPARDRRREDAQQQPGRGALGARLRPAEERQEPVEPHVRSPYFIAPCSALAVALMIASEVMVARLVASTSLSD